MFEYFVSLKINPDLPDYDEVTPFNLMSKLHANSISSMFLGSFESFLSLDVRIDYPDIKGRTPFLNYYENQNHKRAYQMLNLGANVNQIDVSGLFAMKYALIRRN